VIDRVLNCDKCLLTLIYKLREKTMKKLFAIISSLIFITTVTAKAEIGVGITGAAHFMMADGQEITRDSSEINEGSHDEAAIVPEIFIESIDDSGWTIGLSYIPTRDMGSKSRSDTASDGQDTGTYTAKAELDNVVQFYADIPTGAIGSFPIHTKIGLQHVTLSTLETLNSGSSYPNKDLFGLTLGLGTKGDLPYGNNMYYKAEATYTDFETYEQTSNGNVVKADLSDAAAKFSIGYKF
jgi:hypothetical protein